MQNTLSVSLPRTESAFVTPDFAVEELKLVASTLATRPCVMRGGGAMMIEFPGEKASLVLPSEKTDGRLTVGTLEAAVNGGPPTHRHNNEEEIFFIQSGAFELFLNGQSYKALPGDVAYLSRGEAHRFRGLDSGEPNTFNIIIAPGGFEHFFVRWAALLQNGMPEISEALALAGEYEIDIFPSDIDAPVLDEIQSRLVRSGEAPVLSVSGGRVMMLLTAAQTGGRYSLIRFEGERNSGPPLHLHEREDEMFMVEAGEIEFTIGEDKIMAYPGDVVWGPRGFSHTFRVASDFARMVTLMTPGGFDGFFTECDLMEREGILNPASAVALGERYGLTFFPPAE